jgi:hypothetical protein
MPSAPQAKSDINGGAIKNTEYAKFLGGYPDKKDIEAINKANSPKKAPGSSRAA